MSVWDSYPADYRAREVQFIINAVQAGECVSVVGLSGAGKSNLVGFLANRSSLTSPRSTLIDCNRLPEPSGEKVRRLIETLEVEAGIEVRQKKNLARLVRQ